MSEKNTGGPAFPELAHTLDDNRDYVYYQEGGITIRDYFAAKAMQARLSDYESMKSLMDYARRTEHDLPEIVAEQAYDMADAMLKAREQ